MYVLPAATKYGILLLHADIGGDDVAFEEVWKEMLKLRIRYSK
ncbi:hypothetical protein [Vaginella massiliensis]|nr:hypothetical protein [Vaginella massiliensis]